MTEHAIPSKLNTALAIGVCAAQLGLLIAASHAPGWWIVLPAGLFSLLFMLNFALLHEASHGILHHAPRANRWLGLVTGLTFPASAAMLRVTHLAHHRCNRTDHEMFDLYYPGEGPWLRLVKWLQWYSIIGGLFYLVILPGSLLFAVAEPLLQTRPFRKARSARQLFTMATDDDRAQARTEILAIAALYTVLLASGALTWLPMLLLFACGGFHWSTRQYVAHAAAPRRVLDGAHTLATSRLHALLVLNSTYDEAHHRWPTAPWTELPRLSAACRPAVPFWRTYLKQWLGPRPAHGPAPRPLRDLIAYRSPGADSRLRG